MKRLLFLSGLILITACQIVPKARDVKKKPRTGGVIAMPMEYRPEDRQKADDLMRMNCSPLAVKIEDEGEAVIGQETKTSGSETNRDDTRRSEGNFLGMNLMSGSNSGKETSQSAVTTQIKEWQITYVCEADQVKPKTKK